MTEEEEVTFIRETGDWPLWPILPLKRDPQDIGVVFANDLSLVYLVNMYDLADLTLPGDLKDVDQIKYESVEAMVADGWRGD